jgi:hypothetical protein
MIDFEKSNSVSCNNNSYFKYWLIIIIIVMIILFVISFHCVTPIEKQKQINIYNIELDDNYILIK